MTLDAVEDARQRLLANVTREGRCWLWTGKIKNNGYGIMKISGIDTSTHRVAYRVFVGVLPEASFVLHSCDVRNCVNPAHLRVGNAADNNRDTSDRKRNRQQQKQTCPRGHPYSGENLQMVRVTNGREARSCKACHKAASERWKSRRATASAGALLP